MELLQAVQQFSSVLTALAWLPFAALALVGVIYAYINLKG